jgi:alanine racemase
VTGNASSSDHVALPGGVSISASARAVLTVDLAALRANWVRLSQAAGPAECAGVVKADAYGLGLAPIARALAREGCKTFFVSTVDEGRALRELSLDAVIYVLDGLLPGAEPCYANFDLRPVLASFSEVQDWAAYCRAHERRLAAAIHIDTGLNRLGMPEAELDQLATSPDVLAAFENTLIVSHLACADYPDDPMNERQRLRFEELRAKLPPAPASLANSAGIFLGAGYHFDLVRPGIALYGGRTQPAKPNPMHTVVQLTAKILQVRDVCPGASIGYGATHKIQRPTRIAVIAAGYADGFPRALSLSGESGPIGYINDYPVRIVGRVSMDLMTVDVTGVLAELVKRGASIEILGRRVTVDDLADRAGTIANELLSRLGPRVHRRYEGAGN